MYRQSGVIIVLVCLAAVCLAAGETPRRRQLPSRGDFVKQIVNAERLPFVVQLRNSTGDIVCAGTVISAQHVLTAAHCFDKYEAADITVVAGANSNADTGVPLAIQKLFKHDSYNPVTFHNDAAVLKLQNPLDVSGKKAALNICSKPFNPNAGRISVAGWEMNQGKLVAMPALQTMSQEECIEDAKEEGIEVEITSSMVCHDPRDRFTCEYSAGGPGLFRSEVCAILVGGPGCANDKFPGVYTSVYEVRDFIEQSVKA